MIEKIGGRKVLIFIIAIIVAMITPVYMSVQYYTPFLVFMASAVGLFTGGNAFEHYTRRKTYSDTTDIHIPKDVIDGGIK